MDLLNDIRAILVLTSPLWLIVLALMVGAWAAFVAAKKFDSGKGKLTAVVAVFALIFFVLFGDALAGCAYFNYLCATRAGVNVYHVAELPVAYWDAEGKARFLKPNGDLARDVLGSRFRKPAVKKPYVNALGIDIYRQQVVDVQTQETLGEVTNFLYWGGWVSRELTPHPSASDCPHLHGSEFWGRFHLSLFGRP